MGAPPMGEMIEEEDDLAGAKNFTMSGDQWTNFTTFCRQVGWDLMFDFNLFKWKDGLWDPSNAALLLDYSTKRNIAIPAFQLGNEPDAYPYTFNFSIPASTLIKDFKILRQLISRYPLYKSSELYGPDVTNGGSAMDYLRDFIQSGGGDVVKEISVHHYYLNGRTAKVADFLNIKTLESLRQEIETAENITKQSSRPLSLRFTETSSCYDGGAPGLSDGYVAGFLWLDKLGMSAQYGITRVFRQTFFGGKYALISPTLDPNPDFYLSVLFKRLVEGPVFHPSLNHSLPELRLYAQCARNYSYPAGALVVYYLNTGDKNLSLTLSEFQGHKLHLFTLTPGDEQGLTSRYVKLNGHLLLMKGATLPPMPPEPHIGPIPVTARTFGFVVIPDVRVPLCMKYFDNPEQFIHRRRDLIKHRNG